MVVRRVPKDAIMLAYWHGLPKRVRIGVRRPIEHLKTTRRLLRTATHAIIVSPYRDNSSISKLAY